MPKRGGRGGEEIKLNTHMDIEVSENEGKARTTEPGLAVGRLTTTCNCRFKGSDTFV